MDVCKDCTGAKPQRATLLNALKLALIFPLTIFRPCGRKSFAFLDTGRFTGMSLTVNLAITRGDIAGSITQGIFSFSSPSYTRAPRIETKPGHCVFVLAGIV